MNIILGVGVVALTGDNEVYDGEPNPRAALLGAVILPCWLVLRVWVAALEKKNA
ncbi:hypothetical protein [Methylophaga sp.]|uniref:hypothetical protein n=1 Tax=Methylophaga sp. TaxID=2024840 RepID=UPI003A90D891